MHGGFGFRATKRFDKCFRYHLPALRRWEHQAVVAERLGSCIKHVQCTLRQRHCVFDVRLHPVGRDDPHGVRKVDFVPCSATDFVAAAGGQDGEPQRQSRRFVVAPAHCRQHCRHILPCPSSVVNTLRWSRLRQHGIQRVCRVVVAVALDDGPLHDRADAPSYLLRGVALGCPDGLQHVQHVAGADFGNALAGRNAAAGPATAQPPALSAAHAPRSDGCPRSPGLDLLPCPCTAARYAPIARRLNPHRHSRLFASMHASSVGTPAGIPAQPIHDCQRALASSSEPAVVTIASRLPATVR